VKLCHCGNGKADMMQDGQLFRQVERNCWDPEVRLKQMNDTGNPAVVFLYQTEATGTGLIIETFPRKLKRVSFSHIISFSRAYSGRKM